MIKAHNIFKSFSEHQILKGVDLTVNKGEIVAIVGASGAGKTTLLQILGTLEHPDKNPTTTLEIDGVDVLKLKDKQLSQFRNQKIGFVFQFHQLLPEFTALENVCLPAFINNKDKKETIQEAEKWLTYLGLENRFHNKPNALSGGEQQRVAVARALINQPAVIFADEPSGNLDTTSAAHLHDLFFKLRDDYNQTFVLVTHNEVLANKADRKLAMKDGDFVK
ncbi:MAG: ABC transporter ATP-binding protein [Flavobacterium sp.]